MDLNKYLKLSPEVEDALRTGKPIVALESTIISHGMPYPQNVETAFACERVCRENGAVPATCAIIGGKLCAGLTPEEIDYLGREGTRVTKASRRDLPLLLAKGMDGATTVAATMIVAHMAGIKVFATGGIGGVHRNGQDTMDVSADLDELGKTPVCVVCAGAKAILDLPRTMEYLETKGVPVIGFGTDELPAFYTAKSGIPLTWRVDDPKEVADAIHAAEDLQRRHRPGSCRGRQTGRGGQGDHPLPAGQDQGDHRRQQPRLQHPAGLQQREDRRPHRRAAVNPIHTKAPTGWLALLCSVHLPSYRSRMMKSLSAHSPWGRYLQAATRQSSRKKKRYTML